MLIFFLSLSITSNQIFRFRRIRYYFINYFSMQYFPIKNLIVEKKKVGTCPLLNTMKKFILMDKSKYNLNYEGYNLRYFICSVNIFCRNYCCEISFIILVLGVVETVIKLKIQRKIGLQSVYCSKYIL